MRLTVWGVKGMSLVNLSGGGFCCSQLNGREIVDSNHVQGYLASAGLPTRGGPFGAPWGPPRRGIRHHRPGGYDVQPGHLRGGPRIGYCLGWSLKRVSPLQLKSGAFWYNS
jgi:hypothetical protein